MSDYVVLDANRLFSALIAGRHRLRQLLTAPGNVQFVAPKYVFVELFNQAQGEDRECICAERSRIAGVAALPAGEGAFL